MPCAYYEDEWPFGVWGHAPLDGDLSPEPLKPEMAAIDKGQAALKMYLYI
jgi:hypothetical protein